MDVWRWLKAVLGVLAIVAMVGCVVRGENPLPSIPLTYIAYYHRRHIVTEYQLPLGFEFLTDQVVCVSTEASMKLCLNDTASEVRIPGYKKGLSHLDVTVHNSNTTGMSSPVRRRRFSYHTYNISSYPVYKRIGMMIYSPAFGALVAGPLKIETEPAPWSDQFDQFTFSAVGLHESVLPSHLHTLGTYDGAAMAPGSWFYSLTPQTTAYLLDAANQPTETTLFGYPTFGYMEFVLSEEATRAARWFASDEEEHVVGQVVTLFGHVTEPADERDGADGTGAPPITVCIWSSQVLDGQRSVWLGQSAHLDPARFNLAWIVDRHCEKVPGEGAAVLAELDRLNATRGGGITVDTSPALRLGLEQLQQEPGDDRPAAAAVWAGNVASLYLYAHQSLLAANYSIEDMQPAWCRQFYMEVRDLMRRRACDVTVFANDPNLSSNTVTLDASRILGIPAVAEVSNLRVHELAMADVFVAPSQFAARQVSAQLSRREVTGKSQPRVVVIPPAIDTAAFTPSLKASPSRYTHPACAEVSANSTASSQSPCIVVGFVARLAPEKSPGLFLQMAQRVLESYPFARFTVVGDGALRASLEDLAARLRIAWAVHFTGWVPAADLPGVLAGLDVLVNPGLVLETFCIANAEALSMELPLVTFAVGGVGEYVKAPDANTGGDGEQPAFSVSQNAVVVHQPHPHALASAVLHLVTRPDLRRSLGQAGRRTVADKLTVDRQTQLYTTLYQGLKKQVGGTTNAM